jgi:zinc finger SWIM domain-containing protein 3
MPSAPREKDPQVTTSPATGPPRVHTLMPVNATGSPAMDLKLAQPSCPGHVVLLHPCAPWPPHLLVPLFLPHQNVVHSLTEFQILSINGEQCLLSLFYLLMGRML